MKLHKLKVAGWRCFGNPIELTGFGDGLNIVHGPNGVGKSSLFQAIVRILGDKHDGKAEAIRNLQTWGTELAPTATLEFDHAGELWQVEKRFLNSPSAKVSRFDGTRFQAIAEGKQADERVREILQIETPRAGEVKSEHWGLAQLLWAAQGEMDIGELSTPAQQAVQQALGTQITGRDVSVVERRVQEEFDKYFTGTGKWKAGANAPAIVGLKERLQQAQAETIALKKKLQAYDEAVRRIEDKRLLVEQSEREIREENTVLEKLRQQAEAYGIVAQQRELAVKELSAAQAQAEQIRQRQEQIVALRTELQTWQQKLEQWQQQAPLLVDDLRFKEEAAQEAQRKVASVRARREVIQAAERRAKRAGMFQLAQQKIRDFKHLLGQLTTLQAEKNRLQAAVRSLLAPDAKTLAALRKAAKERDETRVRLEASLITLEFQAEVPTAVEIITGDPTGPTSVASGEKCRVQGAPEVVLKLAGIGTIRARGPADSVGQLREAWQQAESRWEQLSAGFGSNDLSILEQNAAAAAELQRELGEANVRIDMLLKKQSLEDLERELAMAERQRQEILEEEPEWQVTAPLPDQLEAECKRLESEFKSQIDIAEHQKDVATEEQNRTAVRLAELEAERRSALEQQTRLQTRLNQYLADGLTDSQREEALQSAALAWAAAKGALKGLDDKLAEFGSDPRPAVQHLQNKVEALRKGAAETLAELRYREGELQKIIEESPYSALAAAEEEEVKLTEEIARQQRQLDAIKLLHDTLAAQRQQVVQSLVEPIRQRSTRMLQRIMGSRFQELQIDEEFAAAGVVPRDQSAGVSLPQLSGGEREQVAFAVRMALAEIVFPSGGELVVLDDVFTFTDRSRLARIVQVLSDAAQRFQFVLLTCHPERYQGLPGAKFFDLEKIRDLGVSPTAATSTRKPEMSLLETGS